ncbi:hypothetical protein WA026_017736 [Henosepilachna vigintioctopunctata]|uniref:Uncharacterized protein n=1 Tax=Henosepilachna vigintioctopunctata TaxID=420089 RepID=A0AAW1U9H3_9CUCU
MRSKVKVTSREELLKNFTRDFLIEEKKRCEIDRYVTDFRILIHKRPHENHNYLNRLLQDYTSMFLSHERISVNKANEGEMKHRLVKQLASKMKESPKKRYVNSKSFSKHSENSERQSYLILKAKTTEFLLQLKKYEELEQIAYELFAKHSNNEYANEIRFDRSTTPENHILKLKTVEIPLEIPYKKTFKHVYVVNSPETRHVMQGSQDNKIILNSSNSPNSSTNNVLEDYEYVKEETSKFLENNKNYNDAEQKVLSEQYQRNSYIKKYVDNFNSCNKDVKKSNSPKKSFFNKIKNMMGFHSEKSDETHENKKEKPWPFKEETIALLENERTYSNLEFVAYKIFYTKNGKFENPLIEYNENDMHAKTIHINNVISKATSDNEKIQNNAHGLSPLQNTSDRKPKDENSEKFSHVEYPNSENNHKFPRVMKDIEFKFNPTIEHSEENKFVLEECSPIASEADVNTINKTVLEKTS